MFHLRDDIRAERSAKMLYDGLMEVMRKKPLKQVRVSDICTASTVSRATFYRNFDEVFDLLYWKCNEDFHEVLTSFIKSDPDLSKEDVLLRYVLDYWLQDEHIRLLTTIMDEGRLDIIYNSFVSNADILMDFLKEHGISMDTEDYTYFISVRAGFFVGMIRGWMENGRKQTPEELAQIISRQHDNVVQNGLLI
jgi:AcrR family transcriptional regulator